VEGPPVPPAVTPRLPADEEPEAERGRWLKVWRVAVSVVAVAAAAGAGYAISEIESTKDENRDDDRAVAVLRADFDTLRQQLTPRIDALEEKVDDAADAQTLQKLQDDLDALDKRVEKLDKQDDGGESDAISARVDELEERVNDLEDKNN
jgi:TolA-binding protein